MADNTTKSPIELSDKDVLIASVSFPLTEYAPWLLTNLINFHYQRHGPDWEREIFPTQSSNKLQVGHSIESCTDVVERADTFELEGRRIVLFDTPGFDDTNKSETEILRIIAFELERQYRKGQKLHGIIYVHRISDLRVGGIAKTNFGIFRKLCGDSSLRNVIILTNMWSRLPSELEGRRRAAELASLDDFFKPAIAKGAMMMHHKEDTVDSAHGILRQILKNHPMALSIQTEIVDQHKNITETGAGMALDEKLAKLVEQYERKLKEQFEAAERARRERDEETRKEQLEEAERVRRLLEKLEEDKRNQAKQYQLLQEQFAEAERKREQAMREAEERTRREIQVLEANLRQEVEAKARRRTWETADLEQTMENMKISPDFPSGTTMRHGSIVSGRSYAMFNGEHESYYATLDENEEYQLVSNGHSIAKAAPYLPTHAPRTYGQFNQ
ncbi:hypothetical protein EST38_g6098 [Candolleomyces aberdarensis]|uniref:G domain-containing protein n=1 Tax=Candolleomyces aberdarensis TaxID=2316362 RepID=A0A4Q2DLK7_9AGAR|nr:hypothetical protein EST38_g6098 [Candolleomyces aberdarensis]